MSLVTRSVDLSLANHSVMPDQNESVPTADGIRSDPSKRATVASSARISPDSLSKSLARLSRSRPLFALTQPPAGVATALALAQSELDRYV